MEHTLRIGESAKIVRKVFGRSWSLTFAGMPNESTYSLVVCWYVGHASAACNLFYPKDERDFGLCGGRLRVSEVSSRKIRFRFDS